MTKNTKNGTEMKENKMGVLPVFPLLVSMSLPMMISMLVQALYNIVDSMFVARVSEDALTAVSVAFPIQNMMIGVASGIAVGMNALLSRSLGEKRPEEASKAAMQGIFLEAIGYLIFLLIGIFGVGWFMQKQTDSPLILEGGTTYLRIVCIGSVFLFLQMTCERMLQATGRTVYSMYTQCTGAVINIILDPILIFGIGPFPEMGIAGAAIATVIGQMAGGIFGLVLNLKKNPEITLKIRNIKPNGRIIRMILAIGVPSVLMISVGSIMNYAMNQILFVFSSTAVAVFGVYFKLQSFVFMPVFGLNNGMIPILSYNYGARYKKRVHQTILYSMAIAMGIMVVGFLVFQFFPQQLLGIFDPTEGMLRLGIPALKIISIGFLVSGICVVSGSICQALGGSIYSLIVSVARQLVVLVPAAWLLAQSGKLELVWWAFPMAEAASLILSILFVMRTLRKLKWD